MVHDVWHSERVSALDTLLAVTSFLSDDMNTDLVRRGLSPARAPIVWFLGAQGPMTQTALAELLHVSPRNITGLVDGLVADGFVERLPHPHDRRATLVTLTDRGAETVAALHAARDVLADDLFAGWRAERVTDLAAELSAVLVRMRELAAVAAADATAAGKVGA
jgi:DNA-binding MarR family transcriptional regulator